MTPAALRRGACPSLSRPMQTGDGLLVRLNPRDARLVPAQLAGVAQAAGRFGNGLLEITARGSLQIRGLSPVSAQPFAEAVAALGIEAPEGVEVRTGALAGVDAEEVADPRPLAQALRSGIAAAELLPKLAPKMSVTVDGGGVLPLDGLAADVRLRARRRAGSVAWSVHAGPLALGLGNAAEAVAAALAVLRRLAEHGGQARGRHLSAADRAAVAAPLTPLRDEAFAGSNLPVGSFALKDGSLAYGFAPAFGQIAAADLVAFCGAVSRVAEVRLAPGRGLLVVGCEDWRPLAAAAAAAGLITRADDLRLKIAACAGAPGCASAWLNTKRVAAEAAALLSEVPALHVSGCSKSCAKPAGPAVSLIGSESGAALLCEGTACDPRLAASLKGLAEKAAAGPKVPA